MPFSKQEKVRNRGRQITYKVLSPRMSEVLGAAQAVETLLWALKRRKLEHVNHSNTPSYLHRTERTTRGAWIPPQPLIQNLLDSNCV